jgi:hypothetical protein
MQIGRHGNTKTCSNQLAQKALHEWLVALSYLSVGPTVLIVMVAFYTIPGLVGIWLAIS